MVYRASGLRTIGVLLMVIGSLMIALGIASIPAVHHWSSYVGFGLWVGIWVLVTGILAYLGARSDAVPNICALGTMIGFAVVACVITGVMVICYSIALSEFSERIRCGKYYDPYSHNYRYSYGGCNYYRYNSYISYSDAKAGAGIGSLLLILAVTGFFVALASSIYGCNASCCTPRTIQATQQVVYLQQQHSAAGGVIVLGPGGGVTGTTIQTVQTAYPAQPGQMIVQQPQQVTWATPQAIPQGYPVQYPTGAVGTAPQPPGYQPGKTEMPPPYAYNQPTQ